MIDATIYSTETGAILRAGSFPNMVNAMANVGSDEALILGQWDAATHYVRDGAAVARLVPVTDTLRPLRDQRLAESDWTQLPDAPLTEPQRAAWRAYRQALRDVPQTGTLPEPPDLTE